VNNNRSVLISLTFVGAIPVLAMLAPALFALDPFAQDVTHRLAAPDGLHLIGRDAYGRDVLARLLYAARIALVVALGSVALGGGLGTLLGLFAGYAGRSLELFLMRLVDILMSFPSLLTGALVLAVLGPGLDRLILSIGILIVPPFARVVHAATRSLKQRDFVSAARAMGAGPARILVRHLLPHVVSETIVLAGVSIATAIRIEASLSFIGVGVSPPTPTWGNMIRDGVAALFTAPWLVIAPGAAMLITVVAFNVLGDEIQDVLDPRVKGSRGSTPLPL
jgi:peptide/nickel transport system permease protein